MLTLLHDGVGYPIQDDTYYRTEKADGMDSLTFSMSIRDELYPMISEQENVLDEDGNRWLIKKIDGGSKSAKIVAEIDLDEWRENMYLSYDSGSNTVENLLSGIAPAGWSVYDKSGSSIRRTISGDAYTALEIAQEAMTTYSVYLRFDTSRKAVTIYTQTAGEPTGSFATRDLNLKEINYKGDSSDFATRLYAYGKDGLTFSSINDGKEYVDDHSYSDRVISAYWKDERYTDVESLLSAAKEKLHELANPVRSYECSIVDLQATNPELYNNLDFSLFTVALLVDDAKKSSVLYQVIEREVHPNYPAENVVTFSTTAATITKSVLQITNEVQNPNSDYNQQRSIAIANATNWLTSADGYVVAVKDTDGSWKELLFMDTNDIATAKNVLRINTNGIGFSTTGANGPFTNAWTIDGTLIADWIKSGSLNADLITAGVLQDATGSFYLDMTNGGLKMKNAMLSNEGDNRSVGIRDGQYFVYFTKDNETHRVGVLGATFNNTVGTKGISVNADEHSDWVSLGVSTDAGSVTDKLRYYVQKGYWDMNGSCVNRVNFGVSADQLVQVYTGKSDLTTNNMSFGSVPFLYVNVLDQYGAIRLMRNGSEVLTISAMSTSSSYRNFQYFRFINAKCDGVYELYASSVYYYSECTKISDARLKDNIADIDMIKAAEFVLSLAPRSYVMRDNPSKVQHGFVAQEVQEHEYGEWTPVNKYEKDGEEYLGIDYTALIADMVATIQYQNDKINSLEERLAMIEEKINASN